MSAPVDPRTKDLKGRVVASEMDDRELLIETVQTLRAVQDAIEAFSSSGTGKMLGGMLGGMLPARR